MTMEQPETISGPIREPLSIRFVKPTQAIVRMKSELESGKLLIKLSQQQTEKVAMKTNNKPSAYMLRRSTAALLFSCGLFALCAAINLSGQPLKTVPSQDK